MITQQVLNDGCIVEETVNVGADAMVGLKNSLIGIADALMIKRKKEELMELKRTIRRVSVGTSAYQFFINEYRQNTPMRDVYGNIILSDDLEIPTRRIQITNAKALVFCLHFYL